MSPHKGPNIIKYCVITSTAALLLIAINTILITQKTSKNLESIKVDIKNISDNLIPTKMQSEQWNKCFDQTFRWINERESDLSGWDKSAKQSLAVGVCNGAVYEPTIKTK